MKVFLSHSSADAALASRLARDLRNMNVDVWLDKWELKVAEEFAKSIERGVDESDFVIVLLTKASSCAGWRLCSWTLTWWVG